MYKYLSHLVFFALMFGAVSNIASGADNSAMSSLSVAHLRCFVSYADRTEVIDTFPTDSSYDIKPVDIGGRFTFKAVMIGRFTHIDHIALYAHFQANPKDLPIHEAVYRGPFNLRARPTLITPYNHLYAGEVERELKYHCELSKAKK